MDEFVAVPATSFSMTTDTVFEEVEVSADWDEDVLDSFVELVDGPEFEEFPEELAVVGEVAGCV